MAGDPAAQGLLAHLPWYCTSWEGTSTYYLVLYVRATLREDRERGHERALQCASRGGG